jgi:hypothetical protein
MQEITKFGYIFALSIIIGSCSYLPDEQIAANTATIYEYRDYIEISPNNNEYSKTGLVFYPAGLVDPHAYIEPLSKFAAAGVGHKVVIVKMPGNLAVLNSNKGAWMYDDFPTVQQWVIAGHSLGGVMACSVVDKYPTYFSGIVLMAAYPQTSNNLNDWSGSVLSLRGQFDELTDSLTIASNVGLLPTPNWVRRMDDFPDGTSPKTIYYTIPGGNHSQFGKYGIQKGDGNPTITPDEQSDIVTTLILKFFVINGWEYDK